MRRNSPERITVRPRRTRHGEKRNRRFKRADRPVPLQLTERDADVLEALGRHRCLSSDQLRRLVFQCSESRVRRRMRQLFDHGLVERIALATQPSQNLPPFLYSLTKAGGQALGEMGREVPPGRNDGKNLQAPQHNLRVNDFYIALHQATQRSGYEIVDWRDAQGLKLPTAKGPGKAEMIEHPSLAKPTPLLPDGYVTVQLPNETSFSYFAEIDMSTHRLSVWKERSRLYQLYLDPTLGFFTRRFHRQAARCVIVTPPDYRGQSRRDNILKAIEETIGPSQLFLAATIDETTPERILRAVWRRPGHSQPVSLTVNPQLRLTVKPQVDTNRT